MCLWRESVHFFTLVNIILSFDQTVITTAELPPPLHHQNASAGTFQVSEGPPRTQVSARSFPTPLDKTNGPEANPVLTTWNCFKWVTSSVTWLAEFYNGQSLFQAIGLKQDLKFFSPGPLIMGKNRANIYKTGAVTVWLRHAWAGLPAVVSCVALHRHLFVKYPA